MDIDQPIKEYQQTIVDIAKSLNLETYQKYIRQDNLEYIKKRQEIQKENQNRSTYDRQQRVQGKLNELFKLVLNDLKKQFDQYIDQRFQLLIETRDNIIKRIDELQEKRKTIETKKQQFILSYEHVVRVQGQIIDQAVLERFTQDIATCRLEIQKLDNLLDNLNLSITQLQQKYDEDKAKLALLDSEYKLYEQNLTNVQEQLKLQELEKQEHINKLNQLNKSKDEIIQLIKKQEKQYNNLSQELQTLKRNFQLKGNDQNSLKNEIEQIIKNIQKIEEDLLKSNQKLTGVNDTLTELNTQIQLIKNSENDLKKQVIQMTNQNKSLQTQITKSQETLEKIQKEKKKISDSQIQIQKQTEELQTKITDNKEKLNQINLQIESENTSQKEELQILNNQKKELEDQKLQLEKTSKLLVDQKQNLKQQDQELNKKITSLKDQINKLSTNNNKILDDNRKQETQIEQQQQQVNKYTNDMAVLETQLQQMQDQLNAQQEDKGTIQQRLENIQTQLKESSDKYMKKQEEYNKLVEEVRIKNEQHNQRRLVIEKNIVDVQRQIQEQQEDTNKIQQSIQDLVNINPDDNFEDLENSLENLRKSNKTLSEKLLQFNRMYDDLKEEDKIRQQKIRELVPILRQTLNQMKLLSKDNQNQDLIQNLKDYEELIEKMSKSKSSVDDLDILRALQNKFEDIIDEIRFGKKFLEDIVSKLHDNLGQISKIDLGSEQIMYQLKTVKRIEDLTLDKGGPKFYNLNLYPSQFKGMALDLGQTITTGWAKNQETLLQYQTWSRELLELEKIFQKDVLKKGVADPELLKEISLLIDEFKKILEFQIVQKILYIYRLMHLFLVPLGVFKSTQQLIKKGIITHLEESNQGLLKYIQIKESTGVDASIQIKRFEAKKRLIEKINNLNPQQKNREEDLALYKVFHPDHKTDNSLLLKNILEVKQFNWPTSRKTVNQPEIPFEEEKSTKLRMQKTVKNPGMIFENKEDYKPWNKDESQWKTYFNIFQKKYDDIYNMTKCQQLMKDFNFLDMFLDDNIQEDVLLKRICKQEMNARDIGIYNLAGNISGADLRWDTISSFLLSIVPSIQPYIQYVMMSVFTALQEGNIDQVFFPEYAKFINQNKSLMRKILILDQPELNMNSFMQILSEKINFYNSTSSDRKDIDLRMQNATIGILQQNVGLELIKSMTNQYNTLSTIIGQINGLKDTLQGTGTKKQFKQHLIQIHDINQQLQIFLQN